MGRRTGGGYRSGIPPAADGFAGRRAMVAARHLVGDAAPGPGDVHLSRVVGHDPTRRPADFAGAGHGEFTPAGTNPTAARVQRTGSAGPGSGVAETEAL